MSKLTQYLIDSRQELRKVNWPTRNQAFNYTLGVIIFSLAVSLFLGMLDIGFAYVIKLIIHK
ncbi:preprotein translocase subunit SecE [Candidatus Falkowbacteria bacterium]|nr:preprotein translocase subunit SecE [Candidatus Falkowbacteria bacterium]